MKYFVGCLGELTDVNHLSYNYFVSWKPTFGWRGKKVRCFRKNIYISKKQPELNENCALKIIIFRYFAFFLELTFYFLLSIHFIS